MHFHFHFLAPEQLDISTRKHCTTLRQIVLSPTEQRICDLLLSVASNWNSKHSRDSSLTLRIAGGWVRDKLLGKDSDDLDVALDSLMGLDFAKEIDAYLKANINESISTPSSSSSSSSSSDSNTKNIGSICKIDSNPEKSKHLETATTHIYGQPIDFVNLRSETYNSDSRIPEMKFGTPLQDALRRDITINALFYNLHTRQVEDFTGLGLQDLRDGHVRTPLEPLKTFIDDPLRILRVIRFASRFDFSIEPEILDVCLLHPEIREALGTKISKERIGVELDKMVSTENVENALRAVRLMHKFGIAGDVLAEAPPEIRYAGPLTSGSIELPPPSSNKSGGSSSSSTTNNKNNKKSVSPTTSLLDVIHAQIPAVNLEEGLYVCETATRLLTTQSSSDMNGDMIARRLFPLETETPWPLSKDQVRLLFLGGITSPYVGRYYLEKKKNIMPASKYIIMQSLKMSGTDGDWVSSTHTFLPQIHAMVNKISASFTSNSSSSMDTSPLVRITRKELGLFVRDLGAWTVYTGCKPLGATYPLAVYLALCVELTRTLAGLVVVEPEAARMVVDETTRLVVEKYERFWREVVHVHGVHAAWQLKPLMNGGEVSKALGIKAGPIVGKVLALMIEYQLEFPEAGRKEVEAWLESVDVSKLH